MSTPGKTITYENALKKRFRLASDEEKHQLWDRHPWVLNGVYTSWRNRVDTGPKTKKQKPSYDFTLLNPELVAYGYEVRLDGSLYDMERRKKIPAFVSVKGSRLQIRTAAGNLLFSGPFAPDFVLHFVKRKFYAQPLMVST